MSGATEFAHHLNTSFTTELICFCLQLLCAAMLISFMISNRNRSPTIQNSPWLTVAAQLALLTSSTCLFLGKMIVVMWVKDQDGEWEISEGECYLKEDGRLIAFNVLLTFSIQFMYMAYFLKIIRIIYIAGGNAFINLFKSQLKLIGLAGLWGALIASIDIYMKFHFHERNQYSGLMLYPQFNQFLCDSRMTQKSAATAIYMVKLLVSLGLFVFSWYGSYTLEEIDKSLELKAQSFILLLLSYSTIFTDKIIKHFDYTLNTALPVFYVDYFSNLVAGVLLLTIHFNVQNCTQYLPEPNFISKGEDNIYYLFSKPESLKAIQGFFKKEGQQQVFNIKKKITTKDFNHHEPSQQIIKEMNRCLNYSNSQNLFIQQSDLLYYKLRDLLEKRVQAIIQQWKNTISNQYLTQKWEKNQKYYNRMKQLNLVPKDDNSDDYKSFP